MREPVIEFKDFSFQYFSQAEPTLHNIDLTIRQGEKVLIVGPSGSGKSTIGSCINGLIPFAMSGHTNLMDTARIGDFVDNIRLAHFFGCEYIVSSIGEAHLEDKAVAPNEVVAEHIKGIVPYLEKYDMKLVLEIHGDHGTGAILKDICNLVGSERVLINYDTANAIFYGDVDVPKDLAGCLDKVGYVHLKEKAGGRQEWNFPALGKGYVDFPEIFKMMDEADNLSPYSIEIEFTQSGAKDLEEINRAVMDSAAYLREQGFEF